MNLDQHIIESEPEFRKHAVDRAAFKTRLFQIVDGHDVTEKKRFFTRKKKFLISLCVALPLFGTLAGATVYKWSTTWNGNIQATNGGATDAAIAYIAPFWKPGYLDSLPQKPISVVDLQTAKEEAGFPIKGPVTIPGWTHVFGNGYVEGKAAPFNYLDVYENGDGKHVSVVQQKFGNPSEHAIVNYPKGSEPLSSFSPDLAVHVHGLVDDEPGVTAEELDIYHKNEDNSVTEFVIAGEVPEQTLELFARVYLEVPSR